MNIKMIGDVIKSVEKNKDKLSDEERTFILHYALVTGNMDETENLIKELCSIQDETVAQVTMKLYKQNYDKQPEWIEEIEYLIISMELYRIQEERSIKRLLEAVESIGIKLLEKED